MLYWGGFADVWKGEYHGQDVAVKVLRTYSNSDMKKIIGVSHSLCSPFQALICCLSFVEVLQGSSHVENPSASKCVVAYRSDYDRDFFCNDIRMDGEWEYQ